jgi:hypothetical protein
MKQLENVDRQLGEALRLQKEIRVNMQYGRDAKKKLAEIEKELETFAEQHRDEIKDGLLLSNGRIGFRAPAKPALALQRGWTWEKVLDLFRRSKKLAAYIRVTEEVMKDKLRADFKDAAALKPLGLFLDSRPQFYYEPIE